MKSVSDFVNADRGYFLDWIARFGHDGPARQYMYDVNAKTYQSAQPATTSLVLTIDNDTGAAHRGPSRNGVQVVHLRPGQAAPDHVRHAVQAGRRCGVGARAEGGRAVRPPDNRSKLLPSDFRNFALTDDAVIFFFGEGQLMPADNTGPRQISVPRSELAPLLA